MPPNVYLVAEEEAEANLEIWNEYFDVQGLGNRHLRWRKDM